MTQWFPSTSGSQLASEGVPWATIMQPQPAQLRPLHISSTTSAGQLPRAGHLTALWELAHAEALPSEGLRSRHCDSKRIIIWDGSGSKRATKSESGSVGARVLEVSEAQPEGQGRFMFQTCKTQLRFHPSVHTQRIPPGSHVHVPSGSALSEPPPHTATGRCCCVQCTAINSKQREQGTWKSKS